MDPVIPRSIRRSGLKIILVMIFFPIAWVVAPAGHAFAATIVLDPGHGGIETGAVSGSDLTEKHFTLALAQKIAERLGVKHRVELTRKADIAMESADRAAVANHLRADLMVSIHAAVAPYCSERTAALYYHNDDRLAMTSGSAGQDALDEAGNDRLAWNMLQKRHQQRSLQMAGWIKQGLEDSAAFDGVSIYAVPLAPLMGADMPAVMLEVGCIHPYTPHDRGEIERQLDAYAESIAASIDMALEERLR